MTHERQFPKADKPSTSLHRLRRILWAFEGLSAVLHPDQVLESQERANLSYLIQVLTGDLERILEDVMSKAERLEQLLADASAPPSTSPQKEPMP